MEEACGSLGVGVQAISLAHEEALDTGTARLLLLLLSALGLLLSAPTPRRILLALRAAPAAAGSPCTQDGPPWGAAAPGAGATLGRPPRRAACGYGVVALENTNTRKHKHVNKQIKSKPHARVAYASRTVTIE